MLLSIERRNAFVEKNLRLIKKLLSRFANFGIEEDDLFQMGALGMMKTFVRHDFNLPARFSTHFYYGFLSEIANNRRDYFLGPFRIPHHFQLKRRKFLKAKERLERGGNIADLESIACESGLSYSEAVEIIEIENWIANPLILEAKTFGTNDSFEIKDKTTSEETGSENDKIMTFLRAWAIRFVTVFSRNLPQDEKHRFIYLKWLGIIETDGESVSQISERGLAREFGLNGTAVRRIILMHIICLFQELVDDDIVSFSFHEMTDLEIRDWVADVLRLIRELDRIYGWEIMESYFP